MNVKWIEVVWFAYVDYIMATCRKLNTGNPLSDYMRTIRALSVRFCNVVNGTQYDERTYIVANGDSVCEVMDFFVQLNPRDERYELCIHESGNVRVITDCDLEDSAKLQGMLNLIGFDTDDFWVVVESLMIPFHGHPYCTV